MDSATLSILAVAEELFTRAAEGPYRTVSAVKRDPS